MPTDQELAAFVAEKMGYQPCRGCGDYHMVFDPGEDITEPFTLSTWEAALSGKGKLDGLPDPANDWQDFGRVWEW